MSWAEIKKAVNSNLDVPLNDWVDKVANDYLFFDMKNFLSSQTCTSIAPQSKITDVEVIKLTGKNRIYCFGAITPFGDNSAVGRVSGNITVTADGTEIVNVTGNATSSTGTIYTLTFAYRPSMSISGAFGSSQKNPYGVNHDSNWSNIASSAYNPDYYKDDYVNRQAGTFNVQSLLPYVNTYNLNNSKDVELYWVDPLTSYIDCDTSFSIKVSGCSNNSAVSYPKAYVLYQPLE